LPVSTESYPESFIQLMKKSIHTTQAPLPIGPFSQAIIAGNLIFVSAQLALDTSSGQMVMDSIEAETAQVMKNIQFILQEANADLGQVVKASIFLKNMQDYEKVNAVYGSFFSAPFPARETFEVTALPRYVNIEISVIAVRS
jgi:2-iminobutanoate/2-iminopropanoate deaminase